MLLPCLLLLLAYFITGVLTATNVIDDSLKLTGIAAVGFGKCVRMNDDVIVVGSPFDDENGVVDVGSVTIFSTHGGRVREKITRNETRNAGDNIGYSLALSDKFLAVSSLKGDGRQVGGNEGTVYVHKYNGDDWSSSVQKIFADDGTTNAEFGSSVAIHDNTLIVGARKDDNTGTDSGSAYVFTYDGAAKNWTQKQKLVTRDLSAGDMIGSCVAISNRYIAVGGKRGVYIFKMDHNNKWLEQKKLNPTNFVGSSLGDNIDVYESRVIIGADNAGDGEGKAYVYARDKGAWVLEDTLKASDGTTGNHFGFSVSIDKQTIAIGAFNSTNNRAPNTGSAYAYELISDEWIEAAKFISNADDTGGYFGVSVDVLDSAVVVGRSESNGTGGAYVFTALRNFVIECSELHVRGIWRRAQFAGEIGVTLNDPVCNRFTGENGTHVWVTSFFVNCGSTITQHEDFVVQKNTAKVTVTSSKDGLIQRGSEYDFNMRCEFARSKYIIVKQMYNITVADPVFPPIVNKTEVSLEHFNAKVSLYTNKYFVEEAFSPISVARSEPLYIGISEQNANTDYKFTVRECAAIPKSDNVSRFVFFFQGCPVDSTLNVSFSNSTHFQFKIDAFNFIKLSQEVYIQCVLYLCKAESTAAGCVQTCSGTGGRRRRSNEPPLKEVIVTTPLITFEEKDTCEKIKCPQNYPNSSCVEIFPAVCRCDDGFIQNIKTKACILGKFEVDGVTEDRMTTITNVVINKPFVEAYKDTESIEFKKLASEAEEQLSYYIDLYNDPSIIGIKVVGAKEGSVILDIVILRNANVSNEQALAVLENAIINNRTALLNATGTTSNVTRPRFLGISIKIMDDRKPRLDVYVPTTTTVVTTVVTTTEVVKTTIVVKPTIVGEPDDKDNTERTIIISVLVPSLAVLVICFIIFVIVVHRRTQTHYLFE